MDGQVHKIIVYRGYPEIIKKKIDVKLCYNMNTEKISSTNIYLAHKDVGCKVHDKKYW